MIDGEDDVIPLPGDLFVYEGVEEVDAQHEGRQFGLDLFSTDFVIGERLILLREVA